MKEKPKTCEFCKYLGGLPFAAENDEDIIGICENEDSDYVNCECSKIDSCALFKPELKLGCDNG